MCGNSRTDTRRDARGTETDDSPSELPADDIYHILQTKRRRDVLRYLRDADGPVRLRDLAERVAAWEQETTVEHLSSDERQRVYISLYQSHLPKLDNRGIVEYDKDRGRVEATPLAAQFEPYLGDDTDDTVDSNDPWPRRYAATVGLCALFVGAVAVGAIPLSGMGGATVVVAAFALVTGIHVWSVEVST